MPNIIIATTDARTTRAMGLLLKKAGIPIEGGLKTRGCWVATVDGRVVGCSRIEIVDDCALLRSVAVDKVWRHKGIGSRLVKKCLREIRATGRTTIALVTMFWNVNFFRRFGFRTVSRQKLHPTFRRVDLFSHSKYRFTTPMVLEVNARKRKTVRRSPIGRGRQHVLLHN